MYDTDNGENYMQALTSLVAILAEWKRPLRTRFILAQGATPSAHETNKKVHV
jgi:hypothetical protein